MSLTLFNNSRKILVCALWNFKIGILRHDGVYFIHHVGGEPGVDVYGF